MKVRIGMVSNSSSSSFVIAVPGKFIEYNMYSIIENILKQSPLRYTKGYNNSYYVQRFTSSDSTIEFVLRDDDYAGVTFEIVRHRRKITFDGAFSYLSEEEREFFLFHLDIFTAIEEY